MAMNEIITEGLKHLIDIELDALNEKHGRLNSIHEWYAVMLEEIEEVYEDIDWLHQYRDKIWTKMKKDEEITEIDLNRFDIIVYQSIKELIQVGEMAKKEQTTDALNQLMELELIYSNRKHGNLNTIHEWYAVTLEEIEEVYDNITCLNQIRGYIWSKIKKDEEITEVDLNKFEIIVLQTINELLQVGAMINKVKPL